MERELIERLRDDYENWSLGSKGPDILREAADLIESLRAQLDEARKLALEEAAAICEGQAKYFRGLSSNPRCLNDIRWYSREEAQFTMKSYAERHESDAAAIRQRGERG